MSTNRLTNDNNENAGNLAKLAVKPRFVGV